MNNTQEQPEKLVEKPGYWAVLPANIRYHKSLSPLAKLLYAEISCLLQFNNKCFASNKYFSRLYEVTETQISRLIAQLMKERVIECEMEITGAGSRRLIRIPNNIFVNTQLHKNDQGGLNKNVNHNNNRVNNKLLSNDSNAEKNKRFEIPSLDSVKEYFLLRNSPEESERFFDFYESKGWMVGKNKMKDWKAAVRNWLRSRTTEQTKDEGIKKLSL